MFRRAGILFRGRSRDEDKGLHGAVDHWQAWKPMIYFFFTVSFFQIVFWEFDLKELIKPLIFRGASVPHLAVVGGSYWFVPMYLAALTLAMPLSRLGPKASLAAIAACFTIYPVLWICDLATSIGLWNIQLQSVPFYVGVVLAGHHLYGRLPRSAWLVAAMIFWCILYLYNKHVSRRGLFDAEQ